MSLRSKPTASNRAKRVQAPVIPIIGDLTRATPGAISLGQGIVRYPPPVEVHDAIQRHLRDDAPNAYAAVDGVPDLRTAIEAKLSQENGVHLGSESRLMVTAGANLAFANAALAILDPDDEVILPSPFYFNHEMAIELANARPIPAPTLPDYQLDLNRIQDAISPRTKAIVTVSPNNPTGAVYPDADLRAIDHLCERHGLFHIRDNAYEYFRYRIPATKDSYRTEGAEPHTISLFSLSKSYGFAAWRIGYMVYPKCLEAALRKIQDTLLICPPTLSQVAATAALRVGRGYPDTQRATIESSRRVFETQLSALRPRVDFQNTDGAFYFLVGLPGQTDDLEFAKRLVTEHGVATLPGSAFGESNGLRLRLSYGAVDSRTAEEGMRRLAQGIQTLTQDS